MSVLMSVLMSVHPSLCLSVCLTVRFKGKRDFLGPYIRQSPHFFFAHSSCIWAFILQIFCPSVCRSGYKRQIASLLMDVVILVLKISIIYCKKRENLTNNKSYLLKFSLLQTRPIEYFNWSSIIIFYLNKDNTFERMTISRLDLEVGQTNINTYRVSECLMRRFLYLYTWL